MMFLFHRSGRRCGTPAEQPTELADLVTVSSTDWCALLHRRISDGKPGSIPAFARQALSSKYLALGSVPRDFRLHRVQEQTMVRVCVGPFGSNRSERHLGHVNLGLRGEYDGA